MMILALAVGAWAQKERILYSFNGLNDGGAPYAGVVLDKAGNLYGASSNCLNNFGNVFEIVRHKDTGEFQSLYTFTGNGDGGCPQGVPFLDGKGNLYGTAVTGGAPIGDGVVFELTRSKKWSESVFYEFLGNDGNYPQGGVIRDQSGNLYGTARDGGLYNNGAVYELMPEANGSWNYIPLIDFTGGADGSSPYSNLTMDAEGNLYGSTYRGGASCFCGVIFELSQANGTWTETVLYTFTGAEDGAYPWTQVVFDKAGNLYGTTEGGGANNLGAVFELKKTGSTWTESVLHSFSGTDGGDPWTGVTLDEAGNLYGVTNLGGSANGGVVYKLTESNGVWTETVLHSFTGYPDGAQPADWGGVAVDKFGNVYGTTWSGGTNNWGTVFVITK